MPKDPTVYIDLKGRFEEFEARIKALEGEAGKSGERAGSAFSGAYKAGLTLAAGAAVALAGAVATVAVSTVQLAQESAANVNKFQAQLGKTTEEAEKLGAVAEQVFGNNFGGSLTEAGDAVAAVAQQIKGLDDTQLQKLAEGAIALKDNFGTEVPESVSAAKTLMEQFGLTGQQAMDFIAKGYQEGLDRSGDFLDSINEYSTQFSNGGASAEEFWNIMKNGAQGGALGTDKAGDAFKEFRVRIQDGSEATASALDEIGLNSEEMAKKMASGQMTAADAFKLVQNALANVKDENLRMQAGVALLGTQYEDLGQKGAASLKMTGTSLKDMAGATDQLNAKYNTFGDLATGMWRKVQVALLPVGKELLSMANEAVPYLTKAFDQVGQKLPGIIKGGIDAAKQFGTTAVNVYNSVRPAIDATITTVQKLSSFIERNKEVIIPLTAAVAGAGAALAIYRGYIIAVTAAKAAWAVATTTATAASVAFRAALTFLTGPVGIAITVIGLLIGAGVALYRNWDEVKAWAEKTWGRIKEIVHNAIEGAMNYLKGVDMKQVGLDIVMGLVNGILAGPRLVLMAARGLGNAVIRGIKDILNIQSPSRVMQELGEFTSDGFVKGIDSRKPSVIAAAKDTAKGFLDAFKDLKSERGAGLIDLEPYIQTLEKAAVSLKTKIATVKEGTPAYREWVTALSAVQTELSSVKGKSTETASAAKGLTDEIKKGREQIAQTEGMERYVQGLRSATDQQLKLALATAKQNGDVERYNAIREEQTRRTEVATKTQEKNTEAEDKAREAIAAKQKQLADNRSQIAANEAQERYVLGLRSATDAQLASALETARSRGEIEKYNSIKTEQKRRLDDASNAQEKAADAARKEREAVEQGRQAIADAREYEGWKASLVDLTEKQLAQAIATAEASGNQSRYNDLMAETKRRADEAADAVAALVDTQIKAAYARYGDTQGVTDSAYRQMFGGGDEGLVNALATTTQLSVEKVRADVLAALEDAKKFAPQAASIIERVWADQLAHRKDVAAEEKKAAEQLSKDLIQLARETAADLQQINDEQANQQKERDDERLQTAKELALATPLAPTPARTPGGFAPMPSEGEPVAARGIRAINQQLTEVPARAAGASKAWSDLQQKMNNQAWLKDLADKYSKLSDSELAAAKSAAVARTDVAALTQILAEEERRTDSLTDAKKLITDVQGQLNKELGNTTPHQSQIEALEKAKEAHPKLATEIDKLISKLKELDAQAAKTDGLQKTANEWGKLSGDISAIGGSLGQLFGDESGGLGFITNHLALSMKGVAQGLSGDIGGAVNTFIQWVANIGDGIDNVLNPGLKTWRKSLLDVADAEKQAMSAGTGMFKNVYAEMLAQDAAARQRLAGMNFFQRWLATLTGNLPQVMDEATAKLKIAAAEVYADLASTMSSGLESALMNGFETANWDGTEKSIEKSLNTLRAKMLLRAMIMTSGLEKDMQAWSDARAAAMQDGVIDAQEQAQLDQLWATMLGKSNSVAADFRQQAQQLPGYGQGAAEQAPAGSIAALQQQISELQTKLANATSDAERTELRGKITELQAKLDALEGKNGLDPISSTNATASAPSVRLDANVAQLLDVNGYIRNLTHFDATLIDITPRWERITDRMEGVAGRMEVAAQRQMDWANLNRQ